MQLLLIRHALPEAARSTGEGTRADPQLTPRGHEQAARLRTALRAYRIDRIVSSPQIRARQTAEPTAVDRGLGVDIVDGLAEYDVDSDHYIPFHEVRDRAPDTFDRIKAGHLPEFVDEDAFRARVASALVDVVADGEHEHTIAVFAHGGVVNITLQGLLGTPTPLGFPVEYTSITRILVSRTGMARVGSVNETGHVRDLL